MLPLRRGVAQCERSQTVARLVYGQAEQNRQKLHRRVAQRAEIQRVQEICQIMQGVILPSDFNATIIAESIPEYKCV